MITSSDTADVDEWLLLIDEGGRIKVAAYHGGHVIHDSVPKRGWASTQQDIRTFCPRLRNRSNKA